MSEQDWLHKDFYAMLGVSKDASEADIKKQYRKLARKYHPDQNDGDATAEAKFKEIGEAYSVLSNPEQRSRYDALRSMAGGGPRFSAGSSRNGGPAFEDMFSGMFGGAGPRSSGTSAAGGGFEDILSGLFGGGGRGGFAQAGGDISARADLSFADAVKGSTLALKVGGKTIKTKIPAGVRDGQKIRLRGKGQPGVHGGAPGDLIVQVSIAAHPVFELLGKDVAVNLPVTITEAAMGATVEVPTVSGANVRVRIPAGTESGKTLRVRGRGIDTGKTKGDLLVRVNIAVPQRLNKDAKKALQDFADATADFSPRRDLFAQAQV